MKKNLQDTMDDIQNWASKTFPSQTATGKVNHLLEEVKELHQAIWNSNREEALKEWADCDILLKNIASTLGFSAEDCINAVEEKMRINENRVWGPQEPTDIYHHIKD